MANPTLYEFDTLSPVIVQILIPASLMLLMASSIFSGRKSSIKAPPNKVRWLSKESTTLLILNLVSTSSVCASKKQFVKTLYSSSVKILMAITKVRHPVFSTTFNQLLVVLITFFGVYASVTLGSISSIGPLIYNLI